MSRLRNILLMLFSSIVAFIAMLDKFKDKLILFPTKTNKYKNYDLAYYTNIINAKLRQNNIFS